MTRSHRPIPFRAAVFDLDGVVTDTASLHRAAWAATFDRLLAAHGSSQPMTTKDYLDYVDGRERVDGVRSFLASRSIVLEEGAPDDPPGLGTVHAVAADKDRRYRRALERDGVTVFPGTVRFLHRVRAAGLATAVVSASRHCVEVLDRAGLTDLFDEVVDGVVAARLGLAGKPDPATFLAAADHLGVPPAEALMVEDAVVGVEAGRRGGFGLVVGIDRTGDRPPPSVPGRTW